MNCSQSSTKRASWPVFGLLGLELWRENVLPLVCLREFFVDFWNFRFAIEVGFILNSVPFAGGCIEKKAFGVKRRVS